MTDAERTLYQAPFEAFVTTRDRLAAELKAAGDKRAASALAKHKRPSISAWAVNQLWWHAREQLDALLATAERLRAGEVAASTAHRDAVARLRSRAAELLADGGHPANEATLRRVTATLSAIAANGFAPEEPGAIVKDRDPPGFEAVAGMAPTPEPEPEPRNLERERAERRAKLDRELQAAHARVGEFTRAVDVARQALARAETELASTQAAVARIESELADDA